MAATNNSVGIPLLCLQDKLLERCSTLSVARLHHIDQNRVMLLFFLRLNFRYEWWHSLPVVCMQTLFMV